MGTFMMTHPTDDQGCPLFNTNIIVEFERELGSDPTFTNFEDEHKNRLTLTEDELVEVDIYFMMNRSEIESPDSLFGYGYDEDDNNT